jgi:hypothetical protein
MPVRSTMSDLITRVRLMIADPSGSNQQFADQDIQDRLDANRDDIRYEPLTIAPSIVNIGSTAQSAQTIFADYYSKYKWWEQDSVLQGQSSTGLPWVVLTPVASDYIVGHWQFETNVFTSGTVPGQLPPVFATGKTYDLCIVAAELLEYWAATLAGAYDVTVDGQTLRRSQLMTNKISLANIYRRQARPKVAKMERSDVLAPVSSRRVRLVDEGDTVKGG